MASNTTTAKLIQNYQVDVKVGNHQFLVDEPLPKGGDDLGPNPYDMLMGALAGCKLITVQMYAQRKGWPLEGIDILLSHNKIHAKDCEDCESDSAIVDVIEVEISFKGDLTEEQLERLSEISTRCPVHKTLTSETKIRTNLVK
jgi:putative redox protein